MTMQYQNKARRREVVVDVGGEYSRALLFAVPVVLLDPQGFGLRVDDLDGDALCHLLRCEAGLNVHGQGVHVLPLLFSPQMLANLTSHERERDFVARMIEDCLREQLKGESRMVRRLATALDAGPEMPLRFVVGCVFQDDLDQAVEDAAVEERWSADLLWAKAEACIRTERCEGRARAVVLPPMSVQESLDEGLTELTRQVFAASDGGATVDVQLLDDDDVAISLSAHEWETGCVPRILRLVLSAKLLGRERIEHILQRAQMAVDPDQAAAATAPSALH